MIKVSIFGQVDIFAVVVGPSRVQSVVAGISRGIFTTHLFFILQLFLLSHMNWFTPASMVDIDVSGFAAPQFFMGFSISFVAVRALLL